MDYLYESPHKDVQGCVCVCLSGPALTGLLDHCHLNIPLSWEHWIIHGASSWITPVWKHPLIIEGGVPQHTPPPMCEWNYPGTQLTRWADAKWNVRSPKVTCAGVGGVFRFYWQVESRLLAGATLTRSFICTHQRQRRWLTLEHLHNSARGDWKCFPRTGRNLEQDLAGSQKMRIQPKKPKMSNHKSG